MIVMLNRVERCELIFRDDHDRQLYLETLGETRGQSTCVGEMPMTLDWFRGDPDGSPMLTREGKKYAILRD